MCPIYEYKCDECDDVAEEMTNDREKRISKCHKCGAESTKIMSVAGWDIKGGGVYRTGPPAPTKKV